jgi:hypothetical protein
MHPMDSPELAEAERDLALFSRKTAGGHASFRRPLLRRDSRAVVHFKFFGSPRRRQPFNLRNSLADALGDFGGSTLVVR